MTALPDKAALAPLIDKVRTQLEEYDSEVEETVAGMREAVGNEIAVQALLKRLADAVSAYDYERGLVELGALAAIMENGTGELED